jgi:hypothetical protein
LGCKHCSNAGLEEKGQAEREAEGQVDSSRQWNRKKVEWSRWGDESVARGVKRGAEGRGERRGEGEGRGERTVEAFQTVSPLPEESEQKGASKPSSGRRHLRFFFSSAEKAALRRLHTLLLFFFFSLTR